MKKYILLKSFLAPAISVMALTACNSGGVGTNTSSSTDHAIQYESPEHFLLGNAINLKFPGGIEKGSNSILLQIPLSNGTTQKLSFAHLVYLAGDFMGDPNTQIGGHAMHTNMINFQTNYNVLFNAPAKDYLPAIIKIVNEELELNKDNIINHEELNIPEEDNIRFNCATGGGCNKLTFLTNFGLYMKLATNNYDHFGQDAIDSYLAGHKLALDTAKTAKLTNNESLLRSAYAQEAYAEHFLTDLFASGHLRTPRRAIVNWCSYTKSEIASYLTKVMHDEDNQDGVWITNGNGERWKTYGDHSLFINDNSSSMQQAVKVMQKSVDQIFAVYNGEVSVDVAYSAGEMELPNLKAINVDQENKPALFKEGDDGKMYEYYKGKYQQLTNCLYSAVWHGFKSL